jgi:hypothetical protein
MRYFYLIILLVLATSQLSFAQTTIELDPQQSMLMTGKGPGQDAVINKYEGQPCIARIKNTGEHPVFVRLQLKGVIIHNSELKPRERKELKIDKGYELYIDSEKASKVKVSFKPYKKRF